MSTRIVCWNIRHGGGDGERNARIRAALTEFNADILVIPEFRPNAGGDLIKAHLSELGYHLTHPDVQEKLNTVLVASRSPITKAGALLGRDDLGRRLWRAKIGELSLCAVYMALDKEKAPYWQAIIEAAETDDAPDLVIGDFNTGDNLLDKTSGATPFVLSEFLGHMAKAGYIDVWRERHGEQREYSWYSNHGGGFRLDHAFLRKGYGEALACEFDHAPREARVSDHSALILELQTPLERVEDASNHVIYAFSDPIDPEKVKIGKDQSWPKRYRQAQSHSPRTLSLVGVWPRPIQERATLQNEEQRALALFPRAADCDGREWVEARPSEVRDVLSGLFGSPAAWEADSSLKPFDDWRDWPNPKNSKSQRSLWIGEERSTGRLKIVHSANPKPFSAACPTYSVKGLRWKEAWGWPDDLWSASDALHPLDSRLIELWRELVSTLGGGEQDLHLGWLSEGVRLSDLHGRLELAGLQRRALGLNEEVPGRNL